MQQFQILLMPALALMSMAFLFDVLQQRFFQSSWREPAFGLMFGAAIVLGMTYPIVLGNGIIFDTRGLLVGASVAFVGARAGLAATTIGVAYRMFLGGAGVWAGVLGLVAAYLLALAWVRLIAPRIGRPILADAGLGLVLTATVLSVFLLPFDTAMGIIVSITPVLLTCNVLGMIAIGAVFRHQVRQFNTMIELERFAGIDPLTNLLNRRGMARYARRASFDPQVGHAVLYFDFDNFKPVNDDLGHDIGDAVLATVARRIEENLRDDAIFGRQGGDEFSIYMPSVAQNDIKGIADRLRQLIARDPIQTNGHRVPITISMGAYWTREPCDIETMIIKADQQLLLAKRAGKNRSQVVYQKPAEQALHA